MSNGETFFDNHFVLWHRVRQRQTQFSAKDDVFVDVGFELLKNNMEAIIEKIMKVFKLVSYIPQNFRNQTIQKKTH